MVRGYDTLEAACVTTAEAAEIGEERTLPARGNAPRKRASGRARKFSVGCARAFLEHTKPAQGHVITALIKQEGRQGLLDVPDTEYDEWPLKVKGNIVFHGEERPAGEVLLVSSGPNRRVCDELDLMPLATWHSTCV